MKLIETVREGGGGNHRNPWAVKGHPYNNMSIALTRKVAEVANSHRIRHFNVVMIKSIIYTNLAVFVICRPSAVSTLITHKGRTVSCRF